MPRTGDTFTPTGAAGTWLSPISTDALSIGGWNALRDDIVAALSQSLRRDGGGVMSGQLKADSGAIGTPGLSFSAEGNSGFYRAGANDIRLALAAADLMRFQPSLLPSWWNGSAWVPIRVAQFGMLKTVNSGNTLSTSFQTISPSDTSDVGGGITASTANSEFTVPATGRYRVSLDFSMRLSTSQIFMMRLKVNGTGVTAATRLLKVAGDLTVGEFPNSVSLNDVLSLSASDVVGVEVRSLAGTPTLEYANLSFYIERLN